jgi:diguanylate cyclase (GGDEF)-like protein
MNPTAELLLNFLGDLLYFPGRARLDVDSLPEEFRDLGRGFLVFQNSLDELRDFAAALGRGNLTADPPRNNELAAPLKSLHANLRHLTWQSQQVAKGDYNQKVQFLGEFAAAFNEMVLQLDERRRSLLAKIESDRMKTVALEQSVGLFTELTKFSSQWIVVLERKTGSTLFSNEAAKRALARDRTLAARLKEWMEDNNDCRDGDPSRTEVIEIASACRAWHLSVAIHPFFWPPHQVNAFIVTDRSKEHKRIRELEKAAFRDPLTGARSRFFGMKTLHSWIETRVHFCICFVDIDYLKYVNDAFGHHAGDEYIASVAKLLSGFSEDALVSRLGGDEFMVLQRDWSEQGAEDRLRELRDALGRQETGQDFSRSISYGVVEVLPDNAVPADGLLGAADEKMYQFKRVFKKRGKPKENHPTA